MPSRNQPAVLVDQQLSIVDSMTSLPFPEREGRPGADGRWGGPGFHLAVLRESRDFWEDRSTEVVEAAERELEADLEALAAVLTNRWGAPETVDLWPYLGLDDGGGPAPDATIREPPGFLCLVAGSMRLWRPPDSERWVGLTIGQADPEWQFQLLAAVGEVSSPARR
ncbi:hypothetical protein [Streptomyces sp. NPDC058751]|uniref:hypothetical protein n=1 Tax=Streptomyces sp. NPDC058751 TaxID=3346623 RepID=UPI003675A40E